jgi:hypothetical protein
MKEGKSTLDKHLIVNRTSCLKKNIFFFLSFPLLLIYCSNSCNFSEFEYFIKNVKTGAEIRQAYHKIGLSEQFQDSVMKVYETPGIFSSSYFIKKRVIDTITSSSKDDFYLFYLRLMLDEETTEGLKIVDLISIQNSSKKIVINKAYFSRSYKGYQNTLNVNIVNNDQVVIERIGVEWTGQILRSFKVNDTLAF